MTSWHCWSSMVSCTSSATTMPTTPSALPCKRASASCSRLTSGMAPHRPASDRSTWPRDRIRQRRLADAGDDLHLVAGADLYFGGRDGAVADHQDEGGLACRQGAQVGQGVAEVGQRPR